MTDRRKYSLIPFLLLIAILLSGILTACSSSDHLAQDSQGLTMASMDGMPEEVKSAPSTVQQAYQFAVANPDLMKQIPCYCGCGSMGHTSNYSCYVLEADASGKVTQFDDHALGCSICVDITQDVMRLSKQGKTPTEIRSEVDSTFSQYGPSNIPSQ
jgi:hypothetical protein